MKKIKEKVKTASRYLVNIMALVYGLCAIAMIFKLELGFINIQAPLYGNFDLTFYVVFFIALTLSCSNILNTKDEDVDPEEQEKTNQSKELK